MPRRLRLPAAIVTALVVAEAAVLLLRPKERYPVEQVEAREYFSAAELERATTFRSGQLWLYGARTALELAVLIVAVRLAPSDRRRPVLTGGGSPLHPVGAEAGGRGGTTRVQREIDGGGTSVLA